MPALAVPIEQSASFGILSTGPNGRVRDFREKLRKSKGDVRRGATNDANRIVSSYNMMVSMADSAARMIR